MSRLIEPSGEVRLGIFAEPVDEVNHADFPLTNPFGRPVSRLARRFAFNQFEFLGALSEEVVFGCAIADVKLAGTVFAYVYEPRTRNLRELSFRRPLAHGIRCSQRPEDGTASFEPGGVRVELSGERRPRLRRLGVVIPGELVIDAQFSEENPPIRPMFICTPVGGNGWVYARKTAGHRVTGTLRMHGRTFDLGAAGALGHHDWTAGYMRRETFWNWGCIAGRLGDGRVVGMNVACGVNETSFVENCFWLDGELHKVDTVHFDYDRRDVMQPWRLRSYDGRVDLRFRPEADHTERVNAWVLASNFHQLIGRYDGTLETAAGERIPIVNMLGYAEHHYAKW